MIKYYGIIIFCQFGKYTSKSNNSLIEALQFGKIWKLGFIILCEKFAVKWMWFILSMAEIVYK